MEDLVAIPAGILNIDKPAGMSSHDVVNQIRRLIGTRRVGHAGTLDPLATGVLVMGVGRATRLLEYVVGQRKQYDATVQFGRTTTTYDGEGEVLSERPVSLGAEQLAGALAGFRGEIEQVPPMYSAIKRDGKSLYELARQGIEVERQPRPVTVYELELLDWTPPKARLRVVCSAGTYIRSLAHDLGELLECGGYLATLRRTAVGSFSLAGATPLASLTSGNWQEQLQAADIAVSHLPRLELDADQATRLAHGQRIARRPGDPEAHIVRVYDSERAFVGLALSEKESWRPKKIWRQ